MLNHIKEAIESYVPQMNRVEWRETKSNKVLLDATMQIYQHEARIDSFQWHKRRSNPGDMFELGEESAFEHQSIVNHLNSLDLQNQSILIGRHFSATDWVGQNSTQKVLEDHWKEKAPQRTPLFY